MNQPENPYLNAFKHECFIKYAMLDIPLDRDCYLMDIKWMHKWENAHISQSEGRGGDPYGVGYISRAAVRSISDAGIDLSWFPNVYDRFHEVKIFLPHDAFVTAAISWNYDKRVTIFVRTEWLDQIHLRSHSIFGMIDAVDMTKAIQAGRLSRAALIALRDRIDDLATRYTDVSFISFADSLLLKTNWVTGMVGSEAKYNYEPERLLHLFQELRTIYRQILNLGIYGVFAQGSNEYYDDPLLHIANNHISLNSLGLPFAHIQAIEQAARSAIRAGRHPRFELYLDEDFFRSLRVARDGVRSAPYIPKMSTGPAEYFYAQCDELLKRYESYPPSPFRTRERLPPTESQK